MSYSHIWTPRAIQVDQEPKYSAAVLIPKTDADTIARVRAAIQTEIAAGWPGKKPTLKNPLKDGDGMLDKNGEQRKETAGMYVLNASSKDRPGIVNANREAIIDKSEIYSGCWCKFQLAFVPYNMPQNKGIGCYLNNLQKVKDGPSLEGREAAADVPWGDAPADDDSV